MKLTLLLVLQLGTSLKLLQNDVFPTKPYKAAGGSAYWSVCSNVEHFTFANNQKKDTGTLMEVPAGTACAKAIAPAMAKWKTDILNRKARNVLFHIANRCCAWEGTTAGNTEYAGFTNAGQGKPRLPGLIHGCKMWTLTPDAAYSSGSLDVSKAALTFYSGSVALEASGYTECAANQAAAGACIGVKKGAAGAPTAIVAKTTAGLPGAALAGACGAFATNACLVAARKQCMQSGEKYWTPRSDSNSWFHPGENTHLKCGGFCVPDSTSAAVPTFYNINDCYLKHAGVGANKLCYSTKAPAPSTADMPKAFNDPKIVNLAGESFEILATGTFEMVHVTQRTASKLRILATIDRAGSRCGATYIQNISMAGAWISNLGVSQIHVRATSAVPKKSALQFSTDEDVTWNQASSTAIQNSSYNTGKLNFKIESLTVEISADSHRIVEENKKTRRFANFLNLNIHGLRDLQSSVVSGLLASDEHKDLQQLPSDCDEKTDEVKLLSYAGLASEKLTGDEDSEEAEEEEEEDEVPLLPEEITPLGDGVCALEECGDPAPDN